VGKIETPREKLILKKNGARYSNSKVKGQKDADFNITGLPWETEGETDFFFKFERAIQTVKRREKTCGLQQYSVVVGTTDRETDLKKKSSALFNLK